MKNRKKRKKSGPVRRNTCKTGSITVEERVRRYLAAVARKGADWMLFKCEVMAKRLGVSVRSIKYARMALEKSGEVRFVKKRVGRSFALYAVFDKEPHETYPDRQPDAQFQGATKRGTIGGKDFSSKNKEIKKHQKGFAEKALQGLQRKAWWVARKCLELHWDNCKVRPSLRHAYNYALKHLCAGRLDTDIMAAYESALHQRHKDATDAGLGSGRPTLMWEASSTVSLAASMLKGSAGMSMADRRKKRADAWMNSLAHEEYGDFRAWVLSTGMSIDELCQETVDLYCVIGRYLGRHKPGKAA